MPNIEGRTKARLAVQAELAHRGWNPARLATESGADPGTIGDFLAGKRWIKIPTQGKIERALEWQAGAIAVIEAGGDPPPLESDSVGADPDDDDLFQIKMRRPDGLSVEEWRRMKSDWEAELQFKLDRAAQER